VWTVKFCRLRSRTDDAYVANVSLGVILGNLGGAGFGVPGRRGVRLLGHDSSSVRLEPSVLGFRDGVDGATAQQCSSVRPLT